MNVLWVIPFALLLGSIAIFPLLPWTKKLWHTHWFPWALALPLGLFVTTFMLHMHYKKEVMHAVVEYPQFITLLFSLFVISGGIFIGGDIRATPRNNTLILGFGGAIASIIGTTGAAMVMIRILLNTNSERTRKVHTVVFFIFVVANCGGLLTPLGDPPLFLGYLRGVPFDWTFFALWPHWLFVNGLLLLSYYAMDCKQYQMERPGAILDDDTHIEPIKFHGLVNMIWLGGVVYAVAKMSSPNREFMMLGMTFCSLFVTDLVNKVICMVYTEKENSRFSFTESSKTLRDEHHNDFEYGPINEVAALFSGIFFTMVPALVVLKAAAPAWQLNEMTLFLLTGGLSSVLDNAPTYVTFFEMSREIGGTPAIAGVKESFLVAISLGAVFMGANTYIGNGPNFMVRAIGESVFKKEEARAKAHPNYDPLEYSKSKMPDFFSYTAKWAATHLMPILGFLFVIFIVQDWTIKAFGIGLTFAFILTKIATIRKFGPPPSSIPKTRGTVSK